jgi:hypothetical protein
VAGYSGTPLARKLGIKAGHRVAIIGAPANFASELDPLPEDVVVRTQARGAFDVMVLFSHRETEVLKRFEILMDKLVANGGLWVGWPKKASKVPILSTDAIQEAHDEELTRR